MKNYFDNEDYLKLNKLNVAIANCGFLLNKAFANGDKKLYEYYSFTEIPKLEQEQKELCEKLLKEAEDEVFRTRKSEQALNYYRNLELFKFHYVQLNGLRS